MDTITKVLDARRRLIHGNCDLNVGFGLWLRGFEDGRFYVIMRDRNGKRMDDFFEIPEYQADGLLTEAFTA